jgi:hypothetical protein
MGSSAGRSKVRKQQGVPVTAGAAAAVPASVPPAFENKAGRYELLRIDGTMAHYHFTNHQGNKTDAVMPVSTWMRLQEKTVVEVSLC